MIDDANVQTWIFGEILFYYKVLQYQLLMSDIIYRYLHSVA